MKESRIDCDTDTSVAPTRRSFARGLVVALPLSLVAWLVLFWMV